MQYVFIEKVECLYAKSILQVVIIKMGNLMQNKAIQLLWILKVFCASTLRIINVRSLKILSFISGNTPLHLAVMLGHKGKHTMLWILKKKYDYMITEIGRLHWNQGEEVAHFAWFGEPW
jgi:hypothetical protein